MKSPSERLFELRQKSTLTDAEMRELVQLSPKGTFKSGPNLLDLGVVDLEQFHKNLSGIGDQARHSFASGCYVEVISLRLQLYDLLLRMFWVVKNKKGKIFSPDDKRMFGGLIEDCATLGLDTTLVERLRDFNRTRVDAIHKYMLGATDYSALKRQCEIHLELGRDLRVWILNEIGQPWTEP